MLFFGVLLEVRVDNLEEVDDIVVNLFRFVLEVIVLILFLLIIVLNSQCLIPVLVLFELRHHIPTR